MRGASGSQSNTQLIFTCSKSTIGTLEKRYEICSKLTIKTYTYFGSHFSVSIVDFEQVNVTCDLI